MLYNCYWLKNYRKLIFYDILLSKVISHVIRALMILFLYFITEFKIISNMNNQIYKQNNIWIHLNENNNK